MFFMFLEYCSMSLHYYFMKTDIKKSSLRWKLLSGSVPSQNLPDKTLHQNISIPGKWTPERTQKTSLSVISPLALPLPNYEEPMTNDITTQTDNTLFKLLDHDYSLYFIILVTVKTYLESKIQEYSMQIQELKKKISSLETSVQYVKCNNFSLEKIKDDPNADIFILVLKIMMH